MKKAALIPALLLLLALSACGLPGKASPTPEPTQSGRGETVTTAPPASAEPTPEPTPKPTPEPAPTFEPAPDGGEPGMVTIPEATPEPGGTSGDASGSTSGGASGGSTSVTPPAGGSVLAYGSFRSDTETALNLVADWTIEATGDETAKITVVLSLESYSLDVGERRGNTLTFNGESYSFITDPVEIDSGFTKTQIYVWSRELSRERLSFDLSVVWNMKGSYSGKELETVELSGRYEYQ